MNEAVKNQEVFLKAAARLAHGFPQAEFVLVGDGPLRLGYESLAEKLGLRSRLRFLGERRDITAILASLDVSVVPSLAESLCNVILESMAAGKPVVASRVGGNIELVREGETGLLVSPFDDAGLAEAIAWLLRNPEARQAWGKQARRIAREKYSLGSLRDRHEHLYNSLLEEKGWFRRRAGLVGAPSGSTAALRVAMVAPSLRQLGGQSVQARLLMRSWSGDPELTACFIPTDPELPPWLAWVERIPYLRTLIRAPFYWASLWRGTAEAQIVQIFSASYWSFLLATAPAWLVARSRGKKTIINYRSGEALDHLTNWLTAVPILRRADQLVVPSAYLVDVFWEFGLKARVVPNLVDFEQFAYRPRSPLRPVLVCTRNFEPYYSVDLVIRAFAQVKAEFPEARLWLVEAGQRNRKSGQLFKS
jgi:glycosyltransferase involved in cell wall biosynthesis